MKELIPRVNRISEFLPFPLINAADAQYLESGDWVNQYTVNGAHYIKKTRSNCSQPFTEIKQLDLGLRSAIAIRCTPCIAADKGEGFSTLSMMKKGDFCNHKDGGNHFKMTPGDIILYPQTGVKINSGYFSGFLCDIDHRRLKRTAQVLGRGDVQLNLQIARMLTGEGSIGRMEQPLWLLFSFVDQLLSESEYLTAGLALDEQIYRMLALSLLRIEGKLESIQKYQKAPTNNWTTRLDDLVDYIRQNAHKNLTLTDLEEQSNYSGRHLQNIFKDKFECSPMDFVRRQRLFSAMEKLQTAVLGETVTTIARDMGYRYTPNFTRDFQREFGVKPSAVLRSAQWRAADSA